MTTWYTTSKADNVQGLVYDEATGENIAVTYRVEHAQLVAAAPELLKFAKDIIRYLNAGPIKTRSDRQFVVEAAQELINKAEGG